MEPTKQSLLRKQYIDRQRKRKRSVFIGRVLILVAFFALWEILTTLDILDPFIFSSPRRIVHTVINLLQSGELARHVGTSVLETVCGFSIGTAAGIMIAVCLWWSPFTADVLEPHLIVLNSLPKTALGPVFIVLMGAGTGSIIAMTLAISLIVTILNVLNGFLHTDREKVRLLRAMGAGRMQIFTKLVLPSNLATIVNVMKVNIGLSWVGVITGEFLVSKAGLGYLIVYGSQVFKMDLVMASVLILAIFALIMHIGIVMLESFVRKRFEII